MAWSWSHTPQAVAAARANCFALDHEELAVIAAEWKAYRGETGVESFDADTYHGYLGSVVKNPTDVIAREVWDQAVEQSTCDNGGFNAWLCPYGCGPHCVPFDRLGT